MPHKSDWTVLQAAPRRSSSFARRFWIVLVFASCLFVAGLSASCQLLVDDETSETERASAEVVMQYLASQHADAPWFGSIRSVSINDQKLYVRTDFALSAAAESDAQRSTNATWARRVYQVLWDWHYDVPELEFYYVIIQDNDGNYIDGGQG